MITASVTVGNAGDADASTYTVTVDTIAGDGTLGLDIAGGNDIVDTAGNAVNTTPTTDEVYTIDNTVPTASITRDDTNPTKESVEYVESIQEDVRWLGFDWEDRLFFASDYFEQLYNFAVQLINKGKAYVDSLSADDIRAYRGTLTEPGKESPFRDRPMEENLDLFTRMRAGEFEEGAHVLRAKIDMAHPNLLMRDPTLYRIRKAAHDRRIIFGADRLDYTKGIPERLRTFRRLLRSSPAWRT